MGLQQQNRKKKGDKKMAERNKVNVTYKTTQAGSDYKMSDMVVASVILHSIIVKKAYRKTKLPAPI